MEEEDQGWYLNYFNEVLDSSVRDDDAAARSRSSESTSEDEEILYYPYTSFFSLKQLADGTPSNSTNGPKTRHNTPLQPTGVKATGAVDPLPVVPEARAAAAAAITRAGSDAASSRNEMEDTFNSIGRNFLVQGNAHRWMSSPALSYVSSGVSLPSSQPQLRRSSYPGSGTDRQSSLLASSSPRQSSGLLRAPAARLASIPSAPLRSNPSATLSGKSASLTQPQLSTPRPAAARSRLTPPPPPPLQPHQLTAPPTATQPQPQPRSRHIANARDSLDDVAPTSAAPHDSRSSSTPRSAPKGVRDRPAASPAGAAPKVRFYDIASTITEKASAAVAPPPDHVTPHRPVMKAASIAWDTTDDDDDPGSPPALAYISHPAAAVSPEAQHHVQVVIVKAASTTPPAAVRPPPCDARHSPSETPTLCPLMPPATPRASTCLYPDHAATLRGTGGRADALRDSFTADEVLEVAYESGSAVSKSVIADSLRIHFLSGHNTMLTVANTPQCTTLAEDAVSTMIMAVAQQSEVMGADFVNELSLTAHALYQDGHVCNLLPTSTGPQLRVPIRVGANPIMGTCVVNNAPVNMWSVPEAAFLSRALIQNARYLRADPYVDPNVLVHVTVLLRQTRKGHPQDTPPDGTEGDDEEGEEVEGGRRVTLVDDGGMYVYLSSMQILWVGHNFPVVHHILTDQPTSMWPLYRQAYGGQCCTGVMAFVDRNDDLAFSKDTLEFSSYMRGFVNRPPRSGSVQKFLASTERAANEELDRNILSLEKMRRDAMRLLRDPGAEPCMYAVTPRNELSQQPYVGAYRVVLVPPPPVGAAVQPPPKARALPTNATGSSDWSSTTSKVSSDDPPPKPGRFPSPALPRPQQQPQLPPQPQPQPQPQPPPQLQLQTPHQDSQLTPSAASSLTKTSSMSEVTIAMPAFLRVQEGTAPSAAPPPPARSRDAASPPPAVQARQPVRHLPHPPSPPAAVARASPAEPPHGLHPQPSPPQQPGMCKTQSNASTARSSSHAEDGRVRPGRLRDRNAASHTANSAALEEATSSILSYGECIKAGVLVYENDLSAYVSATRSPVAHKQRGEPALPLFLVDGHEVQLLEESRASPQHRRGDSAVCSFEVDEAREATFYPSTRGIELLRTFACLQDVRDSFVEAQNSVAVLATHCAADPRPFQLMPVWEVLERIMLDVTSAHLQLTTPSQFTVFGSTLKNTTIVRDLAEVGSPEASRHVDGAEALVGASPLFGSILYETRGVDLFSPAEVQPVLRSMLRYADEAVPEDPDVYVVLTLVRKTTRPLPPAEAPGQHPEYRWDASFSSCTIVCTRNSTDLYESAVAEMNTAERPPAPRYPFGLLSEVIGGSCKTVSLVSVERVGTPAAVVRRVLEGQGLLRQVQNEALRSNRVSSYVRACTTAAETLQELLRGSRLAVMKGDRSQPPLSREDEEGMMAQASKLDALAQQHAEYLVHADIRGFVIYPTPNMEDIQTLFFTSSRYSTMSSEALKQLHAAQSVSSGPQPPPPPSAAQSLPAPPQQHQPQPPHTPPRQLDISRDAPDVDITQNPTELCEEEVAMPSLNGSAQQRASAAASASSVQPPVSAVALSRDSGIVAHSLLLLVRNAPGAASSGAAAAAEAGTCPVSVSRTNELTVDFGAQPCVYAFDDVVTLRPDAAHGSVSLRPNGKPLAGSLLLHSAVAGLLAGYNATVVLQETQAAQAQGACAAMCQHVLRSAVARCPAEAAFFISAAFLDASSSVDLLSSEAVAAAVAGAGRGRGVPVLGKSPLTGTFLASAKLRGVSTSGDVGDAVTRAFEADDAIAAAAGSAPHFLVLSLWQKLYIDAENDVCLSSLLLVLTRGSPAVLQEALSLASTEPLAQVLRYALRGPCYSVCGVSMTDAEPQVGAAAAGHRTTETAAARQLQPALNFYQNSLNAYTGKALHYNSVTDALKSHRRELVKTQALLQTIDKRLEEGGEAALTEQEARDRETMVFAARHLQRMIADEEALLASGGAKVKEVPPFYTVRAHD